MREVTRRSRLAYGGAALVVPWLGFAVHRLPLALPHEVAANTGDALGALTAFLLAGMLFPTAATWQSALGAFAAAALLGVSHWYPTPWLDPARAYPLLADLLGSVETPTDLGCCAAGVGLGMIAEWVVMD